MDLSLFCFPAWRPGHGGTLTGYYEEIVESVRLADRLGWARAVVTEHHFHHYGGAVPNPAQMMTAWARETARIRLGAAVSLMQLRHPLTVAEDYALLDQLSGGRCDMGVGRGFVPHEFETFGVDPGETAERIAEGLEICIRFWKGAPFAHQGRHFSFDRLEPWPATVNGALPIWNAASRSPESFVGAAERGFHLMMNQYPMSFAELADRFGLYRDAWERSGRGPRRAMVALMACLADTEERAIELARDALREHVGTFQNLLEGRRWDRGRGGDVLRDMCETGDWRDVFRRRTLICTPEQAAGRIARYLELGFTEISLVARFGGIPHERSLETVRRMTEEVAPMLGLPGGGAEA